MDYVTLMGAEDVSRAGRNISGAADTISRAAGTMQEAAHQMQQLTSELVAALYDHGQKMEELTKVLREQQVTYQIEKPVELITACPSCVDGKCVSGPQCVVPF